jgi:alkylation response protein AidB-like acyl-CoA dehydrogenase
MLEEPDVFDRNVWLEAADLGWSAMLVPEDLGGGGVTDQALVDLVVLGEELGRVLYPGPFVPTNVVADAIVRAGSDAQRKELLPPIGRGENVAAWCFTDDGTCDLDAVGVSVSRTGERLRLDGVACYVQDAHVADLFLVTATDAGRAGLSQLLVPLPQPGLSIRVLQGLDLTRRLCEVRFEGAEVPEASLLGAPGEAGPAIQRQLQLAGVLQCAEASGATSHLLDITVQYAKDRVQFGRPIGSFQVIKHKLADMLIRLEAVQAATHYAALALADSLPDADEAVAVAKSYVGETFSQIAGEALQVHGGIGFTWEHDVHLFVRRAKADEARYGDTAWHRERLCTMVEEKAG